MKLNIMDMMYLALIVTYVLSVLSFAVWIYKDSIKKFRYRVIKQICFNAFKYFNSLEVKDYKAFEKYDIWRFCVHF